MPARGVLDGELWPSYGGDKQTIWYQRRWKRNWWGLYRDPSEMKAWISWLCKTGQPESVGSCRGSKWRLLCCGRLEAYGLCQDVLARFLSYHLQKFLEIRWLLCWLEKSKCCACLQKSLVLKLEELEASQPYFSPWENHGVSPFGICFWANGWLK